MQERRTRLTIQLGTGGSDRNEGQENAHVSTSHERDQLEEFKRNNGDGEWSIPMNTSPRLPLSYADQRQRKRTRQTVWKRKKTRWTSRRPSRNGSTVKHGTRLLFVVCSAILIGLLFGFSVLSLFSTQSNDGEDQRAALEMTDTERQQASGLGQSETETDARMDEFERPQVYTDGPERLSLAYYAVQAGVFTDAAYATEMVKQYQLNGWPTRLTQQEPYRLYVGVARTREGAQAIGNIFAEQGLDIYVREHVLEKELAEVQAQTLTGWAEWLERTKRLALRLGEASAALMGANSERLLDKEWEEILEEHRSILQTYRQQQDAGIAELEVMMTELSQAISALEAYREHSDIAYIWQVQNALLNYLQAYEELALAE